MACERERSTLEVDNLNKSPIIINPVALFITSYIYPSKEQLVPKAYALFPIEDKPALLSLPELLLWLPPA